MRRKPDWLWTYSRYFIELTVQVVSTGHCFDTRFEWFHFGDINSKDLKKLSLFKIIYSMLQDHIVYAFCWDTLCCDLMTYSKKNL